MMNENGKRVREEIPPLKIREIERSPEVIIRSKILKSRHRNCLMILDRITNEFFSNFTKLNNREDEEMNQLSEELKKLEHICSESSGNKRYTV